MTVEEPNSAKTATRSGLEVGVRITAYGLLVIAGMLFLGQQFFPGALGDQSLLGTLFFGINTSGDGQVLIEFSLFPSLLALALLSPRHIKMTKAVLVLALGILVTSFDETTMEYALSGSEDARLVMEFFVFAILVATALSRGKMVWLAAIVIAPSFVLVMPQLWLSGAFIFFLLRHTSEWLDPITYDMAALVELIATDLALLGLLFYLSRKRGKEVLWAFPCVSTILHLFGALTIWAYLISPPDEGTCLYIDQQPGVTWVTKGYPIQFATETVVLGDGKGLAVSSNSWHGNLLRWFDPIESQGVAVITTGDPRSRDTFRVRILKPKGDLIPHRLAADKNGGLAVTFLDFKKGHSLGVIRDPFASELKVDHLLRLPEGFHPSGLVAEDGSYIVFGTDQADLSAWLATDQGDVLWIDQKTLEVTKHWKAPDFKHEKGVLRLDYAADGQGGLLISNMAGQILDIDLTQDEPNAKVIRVSNRPVVSFDMSPPVVRSGRQRGEVIAVADLLWLQLMVIHRSTKAVLTELDLGFALRAMTWVPKSELLVLGDFINGEIFAYADHFSAVRSYRKLKQVGLAVYAGEYLRHFNYDARRNLIYAASKCGVVQIDPDVAFSGGRRARTSPMDPEQQIQDKIVPAEPDEPQPESPDASGSSPEEASEPEPADSQSSGPVERPDADNGSEGDSGPVESDTAP